MNSFVRCDHLTYTPPAGNYAPDASGGEIPPRPPILNDVSLSIGEGEFLALIGANGSGKTTLARHLNALLTPTIGQVLVAGMDTRMREHTAAIRRLVGMVLQSPEDQMVAEHVEAEVAFGVENLGLEPREIRARVADSLRIVEMEAYRQRPTFTLSAGQMQRVAIAGILAVQPRVVIFDEATSMLDPAGRKAVMAIMRQLHAEGITIVLITHMMEEAAQAQRIVALAAGEIVMQGTPEEVFADEAALTAWRLGLPPAASLAKALSAHFPGLPANLFTLEGLLDGLVPFLKREPPSGDVPLQYAHSAAPDWTIAARDIGYTYLKDTPLAMRALDNVSLHVRRGSIHGLAGATGSGKSTLLQHMNGLIRPQEGSLRVAGFDLCEKNPDLKALRRRVGMAFQMPEMYFFEQYVGDEVAYGLKMLGVNDRTALRAGVKRGMENAGLDFDAFVDRLSYTLSSGEKRKVALACVLALEPELLLLDEPAAGLDPAAHAEFMQKMEGYGAQGMTIVLSSHQMEDLAALAEAVCILDGGKVFLSGSVHEVLARCDDLANAGLEAPIAARAARGLQTCGFRLPAGIITADDLVNALLPAPGASPSVRRRHGS